MECVDKIIAAMERKGHIVKISAIERRENMYRTSELLNINKTMAKPLFEDTEYPWQVLDMIGEFFEDCWAYIRPQRSIER